MASKALARHKVRFLLARDGINTRDTLTVEGNDPLHNQSYPLTLAFASFMIVCVYFISRLFT